MTNRTFLASLTRSTPCRLWRGPAWARDALVLLANLGIAGDASASLIAYWNFNSLVAAPSTSTSIAADSGTGTLYANGTQGSSSWVTASTGNEWTAFGGSTINALNADVAGLALAPVNSAANGKSFTLAFSMANLQNLVVTFAVRGTSNGFNSGLWSYSTDGSTFTSAGIPSTASTSTTFALATADLSAISQLDNAGSVWLRYTLSGATATSGNNRIDNLQINADPVPVPEPSVTALVVAGVGAMAVLRRRRGVHRP